MSVSDIRAGVQKAVEELELALDAHIKNNVEEAKLRVWNASAETEYVLFILGVAMELRLLENEESYGQSDVVDLQGVVVKAQNLLAEALEACKLEKSMETVYRKVRVARGYLIALQEKIERSAP